MHYPWQTALAMESQPRVICGRVVPGGFSDARSLRTAATSRASVRDACRRAARSASKSGGARQPPPGRRSAASRTAKGCPWPLNKDPADRRTAGWHTLRSCPVSSLNSSRSRLLADLPDGLAHVAPVTAAHPFQGIRLGWIGLWIFPFATMASVMSRWTSTAFSETSLSVSIIMRQGGIPSSCRIFRFAGTGRAGRLSYCCK